MGRGTRLCEDLFGPGQHKEFFRVFDYCQNLEFFGANPELKEASTAKSLSERLFAARLDLVRGLDEKKAKQDVFSAGDQQPYDPGGEPNSTPSGTITAARPPGFKSFRNSAMNSSSVFFVLTTASRSFAVVS